MSKARGPLSSLGASGTLGKSFTFQNWKGIPRVKRYRKPTQPNTVAQLDKRDILLRAVIRWQGLSDFLKNLWEEYNRKTGKVRSGYNFFISEYIHWTCRDYIPSDDPRIPPTPPPPPPPPEPITDNLISWWKLDTLVADVIEDSWGTYNGTNHGASLVSGKINQALFFDGINNHVIVTDPGTIFDSIAEITVEAWIHLTSTATFDWAISKSNGYGTQDSWFLVTTSTGKVRWAVYTSGSRTVNTVQTLSPNTWYHIVGTYDGSAVRIYINGELQELAEGGTSGTLTGNVRNSTEDIYFGWRSRKDSGTPYGGKIDEIRIYNHALTLDEIIHNFNL